MHVGTRTKAAVRAASTGVDVPRQYTGHLCSRCQRLSRVDPGCGVYGRHPELLGGIVHSGVQRRRRQLRHRLLLQRRNVHRRRPIGLLGGRRYVLQLRRERLRDSVPPAVV
jgi:hypothetical protein